MGESQRLVRSQAGSLQSVPDQLTSAAVAGSRSENGDQQRTYTVREIAYWYNDDSNIFPCPGLYMTSMISFSLTSSKISKPVFGKT